MFKKFIVFAAVTLCISAESFAQLTPCSSDAHYQKVLKQYPQLVNYEAQFEGQLRNRLAERTTGIADTTIYDIPLVVHVVHDYGAENISDDVIYEAVAYWAQVYVEQNADTSDVITPFLPYIGNPKIRLHLATIDPNGKPTKGVVRVQSYLTEAADDQAKLNQWPPDKYVNVWFINKFGAEDEGAAAYAYYPSTAAVEPYYDGVIGLYSYVNYDKAIPHEIGHVLNLEHPWGNTNQPGVACGDDGVDDTPPTMGHEPTGCTAASLYDVTCAVGYSKPYVSADGTLDSIYHYPDTTNAQNIMDYTYCQKMFTKQQVLRMRTALVSSIASRNNLITAANLTATGALAPMPDLPPVADFVVTKASAFITTTDTRPYFLTFNNASGFAFRNESWNDTVSNVLWMFSNGAATPTSTNMSSVVSNKFSIPGWVTVSLVANSNAGSDTLTNTHAVYAADTTVAGGTGYTQEFANTSTVANWPMFNYYNNQFKWEFFNGASYSSTDHSCIRYRSYDTSSRYTGNPVGDHDDLYTPAFDLSSPGDIYLNFYTSGASRSAAGLAYGITAVGDSLQIEASTTGGQKWTPIATYYADDIANNSVYSTEFIPSSSSGWVARTINVPAAERTSNTFFRFRYWPGNLGNDLYMDNFAIESTPTSVKTVLNIPNTFSIYPNPAANGCTLMFRTGDDGVVSYMIKDVTGKMVYEAQKTFNANTVQQEAVPRSITPSAGMYFVTITINGMQMTQKLVVY